MFFLVILCVSRIIVKKMSFVVVIVIYLLCWCRKVVVLDILFIGFFVVD